MKKLIAVLLIGLFSVPFSYSSSSEWEYRSESYVDKIEGRYYWVTQCNNQLGDDCNVPYSASRIDVTEMYTIMKEIIGVIVLKKL